VAFVVRGEDTYVGVRECVHASLVIQCPHPGHSILQAEAVYLRRESGPLAVIRANEYPSNV